MLPDGIRFCTRRTQTARYRSIRGTGSHTTLDTHLDHDHLWIVPRLRQRLTSTPCSLRRRVHRPRQRTELQSFVCSHPEKLPRMFRILFSRDKVSLRGPERPIGQDTNQTHGKRHYDVHQQFDSRHRFHFQQVLHSSVCNGQAKGCAGGSTVHTPEKNQCCACTSMRLTRESSDASAVYLFARIGIRC